MEVSVRRFVTGIAIAGTSLAASASSSSNECGLSIALPQGIQVARDLETQPPLCQVLQQGNEPSPFVNRISVVPWSAVNKLSASDPGRSASFFRLLPKQAIRYEGRRSYSDGRNGYQQVLIGKPKFNRETASGRNLVAARSDLRVTWLKPLDAATQEETTERFECVDVALSNLEQVVLVNWCARKGSGEAAAMAKAVSALTIDAK
jgi:hypothetical protein